jgi:hypothetical protein
MTPALHIPVDFERREDVRRFCRAIGDADKGLAYLFRMWIDWATAGHEFRKIRDLPASGDIAWDELELTYIIEDFCGWTGKTGELLGKAMASGVMRLERRDLGGFGSEGLVLDAFWQFNSHLSPTHKTMQQKGAIAKHARKAVDETHSAASHQVDLIEGRGRQFALPLDAKVTSEETKNCVALIMVLDRACNKPLRKSLEYTQNESLMTSALHVVRKFSKEDIDAVHEYIIANRDNPRLGKIPERILERFGEHLDAAREARVAA